MFNAPKIYSTDFRSRTSLLKVLLQFRDQVCDSRLILQPGKSRVLFYIKRKSLHYVWNYRYCMFQSRVSTIYEMLKFKDVSMTFQALLYQVKLECLTQFFKKHQFKKHTLYLQALLFGYAELQNPNNEKQPMTDHFRRVDSGQKSSLAESIFVLECCQSKNIWTNNKFLLFGEVKKKVFLHSRIFKDHDPNSRTFQVKVFSQFRNFPEFQAPWQPFSKWAQNIKYDNKPLHIFGRMAVTAL